MKERDLTIQNKLGMHLKTAAEFVKVASRFQCKVTVLKGGEEVNGKSIMGLLTLEAAHGAKVRVRVSGPDEEQALEALAELIGEKFYEE